MLAKKPWPNNWQDAMALQCGSAAAPIMGYLWLGCWGRGEGSVGGVGGVVRVLLGAWGPGVCSARAREALVGALVGLLVWPRILIGQRSLQAGFNQVPGPARRS